MPEHVLSNLEALPPAVRGSVLTIGNYDGVHLGHQRILARARELADAESTALVAVTFDPMPDEVFHPDHAGQRLCPPNERAMHLRRAGADWVAVMPADRALLSMTAAAFIEHIIVARFAPRHVVEGRDFFFGRGRQGSADTLRQAGEAGGFATHLVDEVIGDLPEGPMRISSTLIRMLVGAGRVADAAACLGRPFALYGEVVLGHGRGRTLEIPTANIAPERQVAPGDGIYAGRARVGRVECPAAISVGRPPTFETGSRAIEAHLLDASGDFYGQRMELSFLRRLRDQHKFDSPEGLKAKVARDIQRVREICEKGV